MSKSGSVQRLDSEGTRDMLTEWAFCDRSTGATCIVLSGGEREGVVVVKVFVFHISTCF